MIELEDDIYLKQLMGLRTLIGNTPLVKLKHLSPNPEVDIYAKLEGQNPGGSVKDRAAYGMIVGALKRLNMDMLAVND